MIAGNYHQILAALDSALDVFAKSSGTLTADDYQLKGQIEQIRSKIYRAATSSPFPTKAPAAAAPEAVAPPDLTQAPWFKG